MTSIVRVFLFLFLMSIGSAAARADSVLVFAAASTASAMEEVARAFTAQTKTVVRISAASSSVLARQIENGAPADVFVSANVQWMDRLAHKGLIVETTRAPLLANRLVLAAPGDTQWTIDLEPGMDLARIVADDRLVTGDPAHVPLGMYARAALSSLGIWDAVKSRIAATSNATTAVMVLARGEAPAGIIYRSALHLSDRIRAVGTFAADTHPPIIYPVAVVADRERDAVRAFLAYISGPNAAKVFEKFGFETMRP